MLVNTHQGTSNFIGGAAELMQQMRSIQISLVPGWYCATNANNSNFFGFKAGNVATNADKSNFFGQNTGSGATNAYGSNFLGSNAGYNAINAYNSNFLQYCWLCCNRCK
jgi:hypothetical protein